MTHDHLSMRSAVSPTTAGNNPISRRRFLQAGVAAGGGLMMGLHLPLGQRRIGGRGAGFRAQCFHPDRK